MPFGLNNSAQSFQRFIDNVLRGLPFVFVYIDEIRIASRHSKEYEDHIQEDFKRLAHFALENVNKCELAVSKLNVLGHVINEHRTRLVPKKVAAIQQFSQPTSLQQP